MGSEVQRFGVLGQSPKTKVTLNGYRLPKDPFFKNSEDNFSLDRLCDIVIHARLNTFFGKRSQGTASAQKKPIILER